MRARAAPPLPHQRWTNESDRKMRLFRIARMAALALVAGLVCAAGAPASVLGLPADGSLVNNDPANGIDAQQDAGQSDVVGGSLAAGGPRVPWGTFEQKSGSAQQIFVRAFKNGQWVTQGGSLNIDPTAVAEAPSIDFAGPGRTVPWDPGMSPAPSWAARRRSSPAASTPPPPRGCRRARTAARGPLAQHPHRQGGREPLGSRRRDRAG